MATLGGLNFAATDLSPAAAVASVDCATSSWTSNTAVECQTASLATSALDVTTQVTVTSIAGTVDSVSMFSFDGNYICLE